MKKFAYILGGIVLSVYVLFLILPLIINPIIKGYNSTIVDEIRKATGLNSTLDGVKLVTTPKLTAGLKVGNFTLLTPENKKIFSADEFQAKMSLLPILVGKVEVDVVSLKNLDVNLGVNKDGSFEIEKYFVAQENVQEEENSTEEQPEPLNLPLNLPLRLSNHLPDIRIGGYNIVFTDLSTNKSYVIKGNKTEITDFVLNKHFKLLANGSFTLDNREQFVYDLKVNNKIMPEDLDLHELVFNPQPAPAGKKKDEEIKINIIDIFKGIYQNKITANLKSDLTLTKEGNKGFVTIDNLSIAPSGLELPPSDIKLDFRGNKIGINSNLYTAKNEVSKVLGSIKTGKNPNIDISFKSGAELNNIIRIINATALTFNIKDLQTLSATGKLDADFNIKSDMKKVNSNGYLKIPSANILYGLYNVSINNINADVALNDNNINIKNIGFSILNQPLKFYGTISEDAKMDLHLLADKLSLKGLVVACGQAVLLKENNINSGFVTLKADVVGDLKNIKPTAKVVLDNIDVKNVPSNTVLKLPNTNVDIISDGKTFSGNAVSKNIRVINPALGISVPEIKANIKEDVIEILSTAVQAEKINFNISGKIKNYLTPKIALDFVTTGDIKSALSGDMDIVKQNLNLVFKAQESTIIVPMFDKSKMKFSGNIFITGNMINPILSGVVDVPSLNIPEIPVTMDNLTAKLNGPILKGNATLTKFTSGGIVGENIVSDFSMKGENFYLTNLKGNAFDGNFSGNIIYNLNNAKTAVDFSGSGMNAEKAVYGGVGIKNALSGTLSFNTKMTLVVADYNDMMRSLGGYLTFKVSDGAFGSIGRIENFFGASNITTNAILKSTVSTLSNLSGIKETAKFDYITGDMSFSNGWANLKSIKSTGKTLAYYVTGRYNLVNGTTNVTVLGRLDSSVVALLGPIGDLSADKILSAIPKLGSFTSALAKNLTTDPAQEKISEIPALSGESKGHKDFKVLFNGGLESTSSIKSFKWLTKSDTTALDAVNVADTIKSLKGAVNEDLTNTVKGVADTISNQKDAIKNSAEELKNLFKSFK